MSALVAFLSADDMLKLHEKVSGLGRLVGVGGEWARNVWPVLYLPLLAVTFALLLRFAGRVPPRARAAMRAGLGLLVAAVALELVAAVVIAADDGEHGLPYQLEVVAEEGAELLGWLLLAAGAAAGLLEHPARGDGTVPPEGAQAPATSST